MQEKEYSKAAETENGNFNNIDINTDSDVPGTTHLNEPVISEGEIAKLQAEVAELKDKYIRQAAEFDNFRKRNAKERLEMMQTAGKDVLTAFLDVLDDCDRAQKQLESSDDIKAIREGVMLVFHKLRHTIQQQGVKQMETVNEEFNPDLHEAIAEIPAPSPELEGKVIDEVKKGYYLNDKIIRFAKVVVGK
jgi:molecular chaperone GrpE